MTGTLSTLQRHVRAYEHSYVVGHRLRIDPNYRRQPEITRVGRQLSKLTCPSTQDPDAQSSSLRSLEGVVKGDEGSSSELASSEYVH